MANNEFYDRYPSKPFRSRQPPLRCGVNRKCSLFFSYGSCNVAWKTWTQKIYKKNRASPQPSLKQKVFFIRKVRWPFLRIIRWTNTGVDAPIPSHRCCAKYFALSEREKMLRACKASERERRKDKKRNAASLSLQCRVARSRVEEGGTSQLPPLSPSHRQPELRLFPSIHCFTL